MCLVFAVLYVATTTGVDSVQRNYNLCQSSAFMNEKLLSNF